MGEHDPNDFNQMIEDQLKLVEALHEVIESSQEAEIVRIAISALTTTDAGQAYLRTHPLMR